MPRWVEMTREQAHALVEAAERELPEPEQLIWWSSGYCAGYDQGAVLAVHRTRLALAEAMYWLERVSWVPVGATRREARIRRELAEMQQSRRPVRQTEGWPIVTFPGERAL